MIVLQHTVRRVSMIVGPQQQSQVVVCSRPTGVPVPGSIVPGT